MENDIILQSVITCPNCGFKKEETMAIDLCRFFYECANCKTILKSKEYLPISIHEHGNPPPITYDMIEEPERTEFIKTMNKLGYGET